MTELYQIFNEEYDRDLNTEEYNKRIDVSIKESITVFILISLRYRPFTIETMALLSVTVFFPS